MTNQITYAQLAATASKLQSMLLEYVTERSQAAMVTIETGIVKGVFEVNHDVIHCRSIWDSYRNTPASTIKADAEFWMNELGSLLDAATAIELTALRKAANKHKGK